MKKFIGCLFVIILLSGCITTPTKINDSIVTHEIKLKIEGVDNVKITRDIPDKIHRTMEISNPELSFSHYCNIYGDIAYITISSIHSYGAELLWKDFQLLHLKGIKKAIIYLNSPGGEAFQGLALNDELRIAKKGIHLTVEARGLIASAAIPVFMAADHRICSRFTVFLIHPAKLFKWGFFTEGLSDLESQTKMIKLLNSGYAKAVAEQSNLTVDKVLGFMKQDNWFTAEQALEMGFVHEIK